jgi:hypothetical protein
LTVEVALTIQLPDYAQHDSKLTHCAPSHNPRE